MVKKLPEKINVGDIIVAKERSNVVDYGIVLESTSETFDVRWIFSEGSDLISTYLIDVTEDMDESYGNWKTMLIYHDFIQDEKEILAYKLKYGK